MAQSKTGLIKKQDGGGRYNLAKIKREIYGSQRKKLPGEWLARKATQALISELRGQGVENPIVVIDSGYNEHRGTYVCEALAIAYRDWATGRRINRDIPSYLYVIEYDREHPIKIGVASDPKRRLNNLQFACPVRLRFRYLWKVENAKAVEKELHTLFISKRKYGEWFMLEDDDEKKLLALMENAISIAV